MKRVLMLFVMVIMFVACSSNEEVGELVREIGTISKLENSSWDYGTHILGRESKRFLALKSSSVDLSAFEGKKVKVTGWKILGYPTNNGPEFIDVSKVVEIKE